MEVLLGAAVVVSVAVFAAGFMRFVYAPLALAAFYRSQGIRGTPWRPLVGDMWRFATFRSKVYESFIAIHRMMVAEYGFVNTFWLGPELRIRICDAHLAREVLIGQSYSFHKAETMRLILGPILGENSMLLTEGEVHKRHRRIASHAFVFDALKELVPLISACALRAVDAWLEKVAGKATSKQEWVEMELNSLCSEVTLSIIGRAAFGADDDARSGGIVSRTSSLLEESIAGLLNLTAFIPGFRSLPLPAHRRMDRQVRQPCCMCCIAGVRILR
jgi:cytochrome P450